MPAEIDLTLRVAGEAGEGVMSAGELTSLGFARLGLSVYTFRTNPPEIKGGAAMFQFRVSDEPVLSQGDSPDFLLCFNQEAWNLHGNSLRPGGTLMYDPAQCALPEHHKAGRVIAVPMDEIARKEVGAPLSKNVVAIGVMAAFAGMPIENMRELVRQKWGKRKAEVLDANLKALELGYQYTHDNLPEVADLKLPPSLKPGTAIILTGNEALSLGALCAGMSCFFGYPITPASDIMEWLARKLPMVGGTVIQTEDEIAAITACVGAGFAGAKVATASSGPGISLMVEGLGLASMLEVPMVVFNAQRSGPATGMPTKTEQGDLNLAVYAAHGDAPRIVLAPRDVESCVYTSIDAFNLAEKYQTPVLVLSDQTLSHRSQTIPRPDIGALMTEDRKRPDVQAILSAADEDDLGVGHGYKRYELTPDHVSPMAVPGVDNLPYVATGLEHNEHAHIDQSPFAHSVMSDKRHRKIEAAAQEPGYTELYGNPNAKIGIVCWGSAAGPVEEAVGILNARGVSAKGLYLRMIWPVRMKEILEFARHCDVLVVPELNYSGQLAGLLRSKLYGLTRVPIVSITKVTGLPFGAVEIADHVQENLPNAGDRKRRSTGQHETRREG